MGDATLRPINPMQGMPLPALPAPGAPLLVNRAATPSAQTEAMKKTAQEFEAVFLNEMLAPMFEGLSTDGIGGGGAGEEMFRPMLIDQYARSITQAGGVGVASHIIAEFNRMQAHASGAPTDPEHQPAIPIPRDNHPYPLPTDEDNGPTR